MQSGVSQFFGARLVGSRRNASHSKQPFISTMCSPCIQSMAKARKGKHKKQASLQLHSELAFKNLSSLLKIYLRFLLYQGGRKPARCKTDKSMRPANCFPGYLDQKSNKPRGEVRIPPETDGWVGEDVLKRSAFFQETWVCLARRWDNGGLKTSRSCIMNNFPLASLCSVSAPCFLSFLGSAFCSYEREDGARTRSGQTREKPKNGAG